MNDVRELLGRAAEDAGPPVISTEAVYARAARVRWRRRAAVSATAVCAVAAGAFVVPGLSGGQEQSPRTSSVAAPAKPGATGERARQLTELLPRGVGSVEQVSLAVIIKHATPEQAAEHPYGPLDGQYAVRRDGGVGYLTVDVRNAAALAKKFGDRPRETDLCKVGAGEPARTDCVREVLPDGRVLTMWSDAMDYGDGTPQWGPELVGRLTLKGGGQLAVRDSTGFEAGTALGPLLKTPPLTRAQLRTLMLSPELLPEK
ncbi:hypothetical protein [Streptomyces sp. NBC_01257]|uniref:hypothetical protein n=1 Tax=Streptomyces sp. NBC_01257 TaxID=2903799 RepID=UPI002DD80CE6|nr:hypothetical protein [Streptomyces sp. NBC_01257]WRZ67293.1 hypothetical protein OG408_26930 [Streptomyces sp. NBC_01257]